MNVEATLADLTQYPAMEAAFDTRTRVGWGDAWREDSTYNHLVPGALELAHFIAATQPGYGRARPYCPDELVGTWELIEGNDAVPVGTPPTTWTLSPDGRFVSSGYRSDAPAWCVHRPEPPDSHTEPLDERG
jgi:hypothetical protein